MRYASEPVDDLLDERLDGGAPGVDAAGGPADRPRGAEYKAVRARRGRPRAAAGRPAGTRRSDVASGTSSQTDTPSRFISARFCGIGERAAAGGDDRMPRAASSSISTAVRRRGSTARRAARRWSAMSRRSRCSMRSSMSSARQSRRRASARATRGLAGAHESDQIDLVGLHATQPLEVVEEAGIRDCRPRRRRRCVRPGAPSAAIANAMASR